MIVSIGILRTWGRGAGGGDTSKGIHRILIDATLKAFRSRIHGNLKNPISQLRPLLLRGVEQKANFTHPTLVKLQNLYPFLAFFACIWLWKLDSVQVGSLWKFCQAKLYMPSQWEERRWDQNRILYVEYLRCGLPWLSTPLEIHFSISKLFVGHSPKKVLHQTIMSNPFCGIFARGWVRYHLHHKST